MIFALHSRTHNISHHKSDSNKNKKFPAEPEVTNTAQDQVTNTAENQVTNTGQDDGRMSF